MMRPREACVHVAPQSPARPRARLPRRAACGHNARMPLLRAARQMHRVLVLVYALVLGAAAAAPMVQPQPMDQICAASGLMLAPAGADSGDGDGHALDCALCSPVGPPASRPLPPGWRPQPVRTLLLADDAPGLRSSAAPLPARGPPALA